VYSNLNARTEQTALVYFFFFLPVDAATGWSDALGFGRAEASAALPGTARAERFRFADDSNAAATEGIALMGRGCIAPAVPEGA